MPVLRHVLAIGQVVGIHDGPDVRLLDGRFESRQVDLADRALVNDGVRVVTVELGIITREVLDRGAHALILHSFDISHRDAGREQRVFAEVFEIPSIHWCAVDVHTRP